MTDVAHFVVNEDGVPYHKSLELTEALELLREFPNDTIVTCTVDSPTHQRLTDTFI